MSPSRELGIQEREILPRCLQGDPEAWRQFHAFWSGFLRPRIAAVAARGGPPLAQQSLDRVMDLIWEDLLRDDRRLLKLYRGGGGLDRWMLTIAVHRYFRWRRQDRRETRRRTFSIDLDRLAALPGPSPDGKPDPERLERIGSAVGRLPAREQFAVKVFYWAGWSHGQIARALEIPVNHVGPLLARARERLESLLRDFRISCL